MGFCGLRLALLLSTLSEAVLYGSPQEGIVATPPSFLSLHATAKSAVKDGEDEVDESSPVTLSMTVQNVAFDKLTDNSQLLADFAVVVKEILARKAGQGVKSEDIELILSSGSVSASAKVLAPTGTDPGDVATNLKEAVTSGDLARDIAEGIIQLSGIDTAATGTISVAEISDVTVDTTVAAAVAPEASSNPPALGSASDPLAQPLDPLAQPPETAEPITANEEECHPGCLEGRGICVDQVCFCKNPYEGIRCEKTLESGGFRFSHALAVVIYCIAAMIGLGVASALFKALSMKQQAMRPLGSHDRRDETWRPMAQPNRN